MATMVILQPLPVNMIMSFKMHCKNGERQKKQIFTFCIQQHVLHLSFLNLAYWQIRCHSSSDSTHAGSGYIYSVPAWAWRAGPVRDLLELSKPPLFIPAGTAHLGTGPIQHHPPFLFFCQCALLTRMCFHSCKSSTRLINHI